MTLLNNINAGRLEQSIQEAKSDQTKTKRSQKMAGEWLLEEGGPQFKAEINFEDGKMAMEADQPKSLGGGGTRPGPLQYCFFGLIACYTATFVTVASQMGIKLRKLTTTLETNVNFSRIFGLSAEPVMDEVRINLQVESDAPRDKLEEAERLASQRCPAVFALTEPIKLNTSLEVKR